MIHLGEIGNLESITFLTTTIVHDIFISFSFAITNIKWLWNAERSAIYSAIVLLDVVQIFICLIQVHNFPQLCVVPNELRKLFFLIRLFFKFVNFWKLLVILSNHWEVYMMMMMMLKTTVYVYFLKIKNYSEIRRAYQY